MHEPRLLAPLIMLAMLIGCASTPHPAAPASHAVRGPTPEQAKALAAVWLHENAERQRRWEAEQRERDAAAAREAVEAAQRAKEAAAQRAALEANPYQFTGRFQAGDSSCDPEHSFAFADIRSLAQSCPACVCSFDAERNVKGTFWTAKCKANAKTPASTSKLFIGVDLNLDAEGLPLRHASFERETKGSGARRCAYLGEVSDVLDRWNDQQTEQTEWSGPGYKLTAEPSEGKAQP